VAREFGSAASDRILDREDARREQTRLLELAGPLWLARTMGSSRVPEVEVMFHVRCFLIFLFAFIAALAPTGSSDGSGDFAVALDQVQKHIDAQRWKEAKAALTTALDAHGDQPYVRERLDAVRTMMGACAFGLGSPKRTVADVFCGEVASYEAKTGEIELRWDRSKSPKGKFPCGDFELVAGSALLKVPFDGPHSIVISGKAIGEMVPILRACIEGDRAYEAELDASSRNRLARVQGDQRKALADTTTIFNVARPYALKLTVRVNQIDVSHNGARLMLAEKTKDEYGRLGYAGVLDPQKIVVQGKVRTAWIEEQLGEVRKKDRAAFDAKYDVNVDLPEYLRNK
jgi:hypothetical protein